MKSHFQVERMQQLGVRLFTSTGLVDLKPGRENSTLSFQVRLLPLPVTQDTGG